MLKSKWMYGVTLRRLPLRKSHMRASLELWDPVMERTIEETYLPSSCSGLIRQHGTL